MATTQQTKNESETRRPDVSGSYFGTDGAGFDHYWQSGSRKMTVVDGDDTRTFDLEFDQDLVGWAIHTVEEHDAHWQEIRLDEPKRSWLMGELAVGETEEVA